MASVNDPLGVQFDIPVSGLVERGWGGFLDVGHPAWHTWENVSTTRDGRGVFLRALQDRTDWRTTTTGDHVRKSLGDYTNPTQWTPMEWHAAGDVWLQSNAMTATAATAGGSWTGGADGKLRANPYLYLDVYPHVPVGYRGEICRLAFGAGWRLVLYGSGTVFLADTAGRWARTAAMTIMRPAGDVYRLILMPMFRRCLYVFGNDAEMCWTPDDVGEDAEDLAGPDVAHPLVPSDTVTLTASVRLLFQMTEAIFPATGFVKGAVTLPYLPTKVLRQVSAFGGVSLHRWEAPSGTGIGFVEDATPWDMVPSSRDLDFTLTLSSSLDKRRTPFVAAVGLSVEPATLYRAATDEAIMDNLLPESSMSIGEERTIATIVLKNAQDLARKINRAVSIYVGADEVFRGYASNPEATDDVRGTVSWQCEDEWKRLDKILMPETYGLGGMRLSDAVKAALLFAGYPADGSEWDIDDTDFTLPRHDWPNGDGETDEILPGAGTSVGNFLRYLRDTYSHNWLMDYAPVGTPRRVKFRFKDPARLPATPAVILFRTLDAARTAGKGYQHTIWEWRQTVEEPECNEVWVIGEQVEPDAGTGEDPSKNTVRRKRKARPAGTPIVSVFADRDSQNPDLDEEDRPNNWVGDRWIALDYDRSLTTQAMVNLACAVLARRTTRAVIRASFTTAWHPDVRRFDRIAVFGDDVTDYIVDAVDDIRWECDAEGLRYRVATYMVHQDLP